MKNRLFEPWWMCESHYELCKVISDDGLHAICIDRCLSYSEEEEALPELWRSAMCVRPFRSYGVYDELSKFAIHGLVTLSL